MATMDPTDPEGLREQEDTFPCLIAPAECSFRGTWQEAQAHAPTHQLPHPDDRKAWVPARRTFIGASEVGYVAGLATFKNALDIWVDKVQPLPEGKMGGRSRMGQVLEPALLADFGERHQVHLLRPRTRRHPDFPFLAATPDSLIADGPAVRARQGVQCKVVGSRAARWWLNGPPTWVIAQVQSEMACFDLDMITVLAMVDTDEPQEFEIERDRATFEFLAEIVGMFWHTAVIPRVLPIDFDEKPSIGAVERAFPAMLQPMAQATPDEMGLAVSYYRAQKEQAEIEERLEGLGARLRATIGRREGVTGRLGTSDVLATWRPPKGSTLWKEAALDAMEDVAKLKELAAEGGDVAAALAEVPPAETMIAKRTPALGTRRLLVRVRE